MRRVFFVGPNGCGKGTQINRLASAAEKAGHRFKAISVSGVLKKNPECVARMNAGQLVDDPLVIRAVDEELRSLDCETAVFDGFPRSLEQAKRVIEMAREGPGVMVLRLNVSDATGAARCGGRGRGADDTPEVVQGRLEVYRRETLPGINLLEEAIPEHCLSIDGDQSEEAVFAAISEHLAF